MRFTEDQIKTMWKVLCATQGVPRTLAGLTPRERQLLVKRIKKQEDVNDEIPIVGVPSAFSSIPPSPPDRLSYMGVDYEVVPEEVKPSVHDDLHAGAREELALYRDTEEPFPGETEDTDGIDAQQFHEDGTPSEGGSSGSSEPATESKAAYDW